MSVVNFTIPKTLERRVSKAIKERGFSSKAEFFRMAAMRYVEDRNDDLEIAYLTEAIGEQISKKFKNKKLPSLEEQLADI